MGLGAAWWETYGDTEHRIGCSWSAWPTRLFQPQISRSRVLCRRRLRHNSGTAVSTGAGRPEESKAKMEEEETRDYSSQGLSNLLFLVPLRRKRAPRAGERQEERGRKEVRENAHQRVQSGSSATSSKEVRRSRNCSTRTKVTLFVMRFKKAVKTVPRARVNTYASDAEECVVISIASACRAGSQLSPELHLHSPLSTFLPRPLLSHTSLS